MAVSELKRKAQLKALRTNRQPVSNESALEAYCHTGRTRTLAVRDLERSGLTIQQAQCEGIFDVDDASAVNPNFASRPAVIFPYRRRDGSPTTYNDSGRDIPYCRARYLTGPGQKAAKGRRYDQPKGSGVAIYFPKGFDLAALEAGKLDNCVIVEGEKKAIALCAADIPAVGLSGVDCFRQGKALHPDLDYVASNCAEIAIVFDSDIETNTRVQAAELRLAGDLALRGAKVHLVRLPAGNDGAKVGADDYLVANGADALIDLICETPALGETASGDPTDMISVTDLLKWDVKPVPELIPHWVQQGVPNFIAGPGGTHKSRLALQWCLCLNAGANIWGFGGKRTTFVYYSAEDDENELARRAQAISKRLKLKPSNQGLFVPRKGKDSALVVMHEDGRVDVRPFYHDVVSHLRSIEGHKIVVFDSAYDFVRFAGRAKIDEDAVNYFIKVVLQGICDQANCTLLIPWHPSQAGSSRGEMDGWSVAWQNAPRARLSINKSNEVDDAYEL